jgi:hypothetical protein
VIKLRKSEALKIGLHILRVTHIKISFRNLYNLCHSHWSHGLSNNGIVVSNPVRGILVCQRFPVLCCPVWVIALRWADPPFKES